VPVDAFAERLNRLFDTVHPPDRGPYTNQEVAKLLRERGGPTLSHVYLWQLRTGRRDNPTRRHLEALAGFFGVPVAYFFDDDTAAKVASELEFVQQLRENKVQRVAARVAGLSPQSMEQILAAIEHIREQEGMGTAVTDESADENL
jgi:ESX-1-secreted protein regulator